MNARACSLTVFAPIGQIATLKGVKKSQDKVPEKDRNEIEKHIREDLKKYYKVINNFSMRGEPDPTHLFREKMVPKIRELFRRGIIVRAKALGEMR